MKSMRLRHILLFLLMAVFVTPIRASIHTDYLLGGSLTLKNGKELDLMHGLNTYDYGARQYYPIVGRWNRVDPLAENKSRQFLENHKNSPMFGAKRRRAPPVE
jgi:hypothetical protein